MGKQCVVALLSNQCVFVRHGFFFFREIKQDYRLVLLIFVPALSAMLAQIQILHFLVIIPNKNHFWRQIVCFRMCRTICIWTRTLHAW